MRTHLRLAERQGLLAQRHISQAQSMALIILNHCDLIDREERSSEALKLSMLANGNFDHKVLFPDYFPDKGKDNGEIIEVTGEDQIPDGAVVDYSHVEWKSPSDNMAEYERMMAALQQASSGQISGEVMGDPSWGDWQ